MAEKEDNFDSPAAGAVRASGLLAGPEFWVYIDWKDGKLSGHEQAVMCFTESAKAGVEVGMPGVYSGPAAFSTREEFYGTATGLILECEFSEPVDVEPVGVATLGQG